MGIVQRQGIKYSLVSYFGVAIGMLSTFLVYPYDLEVYGLFRFLVDTANLLAPFVLLGMVAVSTKFFPIFSEGNKKNNGFLGFLTLGALLGCTLFLGLWWIIKTPIMTFFSHKSSPLYELYVPYIVPLVFLTVFFMLYRGYASNFKRIAIPAVLEQLIKITFPILLILYVAKWISLELLVWGILVNFIVVVLAAVYYIYHLGQLHLKPNFRFFNKALFKQMAAFALFSVMTNTGSVLASRIDTLMVGSMLDLKKTGIYGLAALIASIIGIPLLAVNGITAPIISKALKEDNLQEINSLYRKSSINLLLIGLFLFLGLWCSIDELLLLISKDDDLATGKYVILFLGIAKVFDLATGINDSITGFSKYYRFNFYTLMVLAVLNIVGNIIFIPTMGILGAAFAPMLASLLFNIVKYFYIKYKFGMQPFTLQTAKLLMISVVVYTVVQFLPTLPSPFLSLLLKSTIITLLYLPAVLYFGISEEVNGVVKGILKNKK
jgi:O-antigen/teichoic acid export membrane protein